MAQTKAYVAVRFQDKDGWHEVGEEYYCDLNSPARIASFRSALNYGLLTEELNDMQRNVMRERGLAQAAQVARAEALAPPVETEEVTEAEPAPAEEPKKKKTTARPKG